MKHFFAVALSAAFATFSAQAEPNTSPTPKAQNQKLECRWAAPTCSMLGSIGPGTGGAVMNGLSSPDGKVRAFASLNSAAGLGHASSVLSFAIQDVDSGRMSLTQNYNVDDNGSVSGDVSLIGSSGKRYVLVCLGSRLPDGDNVSFQPGDCSK